MSTAQRIAAITEAANGADFSLVVNEVYSLPENSLTVKAVRIPTMQDVARAVTQTIHNDGILRFTPSELAEAMQAAGYAESRQRFNNGRFEYIYYFSVISETNPGNAEVNRFRLDPVQAAQIRQREVDRRANASALFDSLVADGAGIQFSESFVRGLRKEARK